MALLQEHEKDVRDVARPFVNQELIPLERKVENLDAEVWQRLARQAAELGFTGLGFPAEYGGVEASLTTICTVMREFGRTSHSFINRLLLAVDRTLVFGNEEQKRRWLEPALRGDCVTAFALSEPQGGSDAANLKTRAVRKSDGWVLNGQKVFTTLAPIADVVVTVVTTGQRSDGRQEVSLFLVPTDAPGFSCGGDNDKVGYRGVPQSDTFFDDCEIGDDALLGDVGGGWQMVNTWTDSVRVVQAAFCLGSAERCLDMAIDYANERVTFSAALATRQAIQWMLADSAVEWSSVLRLTRHAAELADEGKPFAFEAAMAKVAAGDMAGRVIDRAMQIFGGYGYMREYPFDLLQRDVRLVRIGGGSSEMMRLMISRDLLRGRKRLSRESFA